MERNRSLDVCRGLLILLVVFHHIPQVFQLLGYKGQIIQILDGLKIYYADFFMAAFFLISGYASDFNKPFLKSTVKTARHLFIPALVVNFILRFRGFDSVYSIICITLEGSGFWFLSAMFIARALYQYIYI